MARMIDVIDVLEQLKQAEREMYVVTPLGCKAVDIKAVIHYIESRPTVVAVEVVRCKECRFSVQHDIYDPMECMKWKTKWGVAYTTPDGHCHKGERKDNG